MLSALIVYFCNMNFTGMLCFNVMELYAFGEQRCPIDINDAIIIVNRIIHQNIERKIEFIIELEQFEYEKKINHTNSVLFVLIMHLYMSDIAYRCILEFCDAIK